MASGDSCEKVKYKDQNFTSILLESHQMCWEQKLYTDITLRMEDLMLPCHKLVLSGGSPYFAAMFQSGMTETMSDVVEMRGIDKDALMSLVKFMYTATIDIDPDNVQSLYQASDLIQVRSVKKACAEYMLRHISPANCISVYKFASMYNEQELQDAGHSFMSQYFADVVEHEDFVKLSKMELIRYLSDEKLNVDTEDEVLNAMIKWVTYEIKSRADQFEEIVKSVNLQKCSPRCLYDVFVKTEPFLKNETLVKHVLTASWAPNDLQMPVPRGDQLTGNSILVCDDRKRFLYLKSDSSWGIIPEIGKGLNGFGMCATKQAIIVTGGYSKSGATQECWQFDIRDRKWKEMPKRIYARSNHLIVCHKDMLYVIGGYNSGTWIGQVESLSSNLSGKWVAKKNIICEFRCDTIVSWEDYIYVFDGQNRKVQMYDPMKDSWTLKSAMPIYECQIRGCVAFGDTIYLSGGKESSFMSYSPADDAWTILQPPPYTHESAPVVLWKNKILVLGGERQKHISVYDPWKNKWSASKLTMFGFMDRSCVAIAIPFKISK